MVDRQKKVPTTVDFETAKSKHKPREHDGVKWADMPTRYKNRMALQEMYCREYSELSDAIMGRK